MWIDETGRIQTDLFRKKNMKCQYLLPSSSHPRHIFPNIAKSMSHRVVRICSRVEDRDKKLDEMREMLEGRGYKRKMLNDALEYAKNLNRSEALKKVDREKKNENRVRYCYTFDKRLPSVAPILVQNWKTMCESDQRLKTIFPNPPMSCVRRGKNLQDELCRARLPKAQGGTNTRSATGNRVVGFRNCGAMYQKQCRLCPFSTSNGQTVVTEVTIFHSGQIILIRQNITCRDSNVIYILTCLKPECRGIQYLGETGRMAYERFREHLDSAQDPNTTCPVGLHWRLPGHRLEHMQFVPFERLHCGKAARKQREKNYIDKYDMIRQGLNINL